MNFFQKNHVDVKPVMNLMAWSAIISILDVFLSTDDSFIESLIGFLINVYGFIVMYSIYKTYEDQSKPNLTRISFQQDHENDVKPEEV